MSRDLARWPGEGSAQTIAIQKAIYACGGRVGIPAGEYLNGTILLRSHVTLHPDNGAVHKGSPSIEDYPEVGGGFVDAVGQRRNRCLLYAERTDGPAITRLGRIDDNGGAFGHEEDERPFMIHSVDCTQARVQDVTLRDSPGWVSHYLVCENVCIQGVTLRSHTNGIDAICIKATGTAPCENIVVTSCVIYSIWIALKLGTESVGHFRNIVFSDLVIRDTHGGRLKIIIMDGCVLENVHVSNIAMNRVSGPIFLRLGRCLRWYFADQPERPPGQDAPCVRPQRHRAGLGRGIPARRQAAAQSADHPHGRARPRHRRRVLREHRPHLSRRRRRALRPARRARARNRVLGVPMFHPLPKWGFYLRQARNIRLRDVRLRTSRPKARPHFSIDGVSNLRLDEIEVDGQSLRPLTFSTVSLSCPEIHSS